MGEGSGIPCGRRLLLLLLLLESACFPSPQSSVQQLCSVISPVSRSMFIRPSVCSPKQNTKKSQRSAVDTCVVIYDDNEHDHCLLLCCCGCCCTRSIRQTRHLRAAFTLAHNVYYVFRLRTRYRLVHIYNQLIHNISYILACFAEHPCPLLLLVLLLLPLLRMCQPRPRAN